MRGQLEPIDLAQLSSIVRDQLGDAIADLELSAAVATQLGDVIGPSATKLNALPSDLYTMMAKNRVRVMVLDRCAADVPELVGDWYHSGRYAVVDLWKTYLDQRASRIVASIDHDMLARTIVEIITLWAVKMPWDPAPRPYTADNAAACAVMIRNLVTGDKT